jgi:hypothetical protein
VWEARHEKREREREKEREREVKWVKNEPIESLHVNVV